MSPALLTFLLLAATQQPPTFRASITSVYVDVFVRSASGPIPDLTAADFVLTDDGVPQEIELMAVESAPLTTVFVLDTSDSIDDAKLRHLQAAGHAYLERLQPGDETALVGFNEEVQLRVPFTTDIPRLTRGLNGVLPRGATALYDGLYVGMTLAPDRKRSLLVLFTDGDDNVSWLDAAQLARVVEESNVLLQIVTTTPRGDSRRSTAPYLRFLRRLAETTGGELWEAESSETLASAFGAILEAMKTRYVLRFEPPAGARAGLHRLQVKLTRRRAKLQFRRTYFVAPPAR